MAFYSIPQQDQLQEAHGRSLKMCIRDGVAATSGVSYRNLAMESQNNMTMVLTMPCYLLYQLPHPFHFNDHTTHNWSKLVIAAVLLTKYKYQ